MLQYLTMDWNLKRGIERWESHEIVIVYWNVVTMDWNADSYKCKYTQDWNAPKVTIYCNITELRKSIVMSLYVNMV